MFSHGSDLGPLLFSHYTRWLAVSPHPTTLISTPMSMTLNSTLLCFLALWHSGRGMHLCLSFWRLFWMFAHFFKLSLNKILCFPETSCHLSIANNGKTMVTPAWTAKNFNMNLDNWLPHKALTAATLQSCRFTCYNIAQIRPFLTDSFGQLLCSNHCNSLSRVLHLPPFSPETLHPASATHPECYSLPHLQLHVPSIPQSLHHLPVATFIKFKIVVHVDKAVNGSGPPYLQTMV